MDTKPSGPLEELRSAARQVWIGPGGVTSSMELLRAIEAVCHLADSAIRESGFKEGSIMAGAVREAFEIEKKRVT